MKHDPIFESDIDKQNKQLSEEQKLEYKKTVKNLKDTFSTKAGGHTLLKLVHDLYLFRPYRQQNAGAYAKEGKREYILEIVETLGIETFLELYKKSIKQQITEE